MRHGAASVEDRMVVPQKVRHRITIGPSNSTSKQMLQIIERRVSVR